MSLVNTCSQLDFSRYFATAAAATATECVRVQYRIRTVCLDLAATFWLCVSFMFLLLFVICHCGVGIFPPFLLILRFAWNSLAC